MYEFTPRELATWCIEAAFAVVNIGLLLLTIAAKNKPDRFRRVRAVLSAELTSLFLLTLLVAIGQLFIVYDTAYFGGNKRFFLWRIYRAIYLGSFFNALLMAGTRFIITLSSMKMKQWLPNKASDATSEPAQGAASSAHQG